MPGWNAMGCDPSDSGGVVFEFCQRDDFPWMQISELTKGGCCMAMTIRFFEHYNRGGSVIAFFDWLKSPTGREDIIQTQEKYLNHSRFGGAVFSALRAIARIAEDSKLVSMGFTKVHGPIFPTIAFSSLPGEATKEFVGEPRVFKIVYLSDLSDGSAHAMGFVLDTTVNAFLFFDPNEGVAQFSRAEQMRQWLVNVYPQYGDDWSGYYMDTWKI